MSWSNRGWTAIFATTSFFFLLVSVWLFFSAHRAWAHFRVCVYSCDKTKMPIRNRSKSDYYWVLQNAMHLFGRANCTDDKHTSPWAPNADCHIENISTVLDAAQIAVNYISFNFNVYFAVANGADSKLPTNKITALQQKKKNLLLFSFFCSK